MMQIKDALTLQWLGARRSEQSKCRQHAASGGSMSHVHTRSIVAVFIRNLDVMSHLEEPSEKQRQVLNELLLVISTLFVTAQQS